MTELDTIIDGFQRVSLLAQLRDKVFYALDAGKPRCGACYHWMKSRNCPREHNVNGYTRGPSADERPCSKYQQEPRVADLMKTRTAEAVSFAQEHGLPIPDVFGDAP